MGLTILLVGSSLIVPMNESQRLDSEVKRCAIVREGSDRVIESMRLDSEFKRRAIAQEDVEKAPKGKVTA